MLKKRMTKMNLMLACLMVTTMACSDPKEEPGKGSGDNNGGGTSGAVTEVTPVKSNLIVDLSTDKACYAPGQTVNISASEHVAGAKVRYRRGAEVIGEEAMSGSSWQWQPPTEDFTGYMVEVYRPGDDGSVTILGTIAVDVSSDWTRFPRYGFVATFDASKMAAGVIEKEMEYLNRCHINGVQFQDWHNKHHWPLGGTRGNLDAVYKDIANRDVSTEVVKKYIEVQHSLGMKSMFYNLCFGALDDAASDGVKEQWYAFKNNRHGDKDMHQLPSSWKSSIYLLDPANREWQAYIAERNDEVYSSFDFDGYQIDQLGSRGDLYDYSGSKLNLPKGYASFIDAMKQRHPEKRLVMNAVSSYGASQIAGSGKVDFCYNELWGDEADFTHLHSVIKANDNYSSHTLRTVFAAYMNYDKAGRETGEFNTPGVIMADAVMMALGGSHLELGDHMLSREYFPASPLAMSEELKTAMIRYYDFMTAYQNLLRGTSTQTEFDPQMTCSDASKKVTVAAWPPKKGNVTTYSRQVGDKMVISLLNFVNIDNMSWRDLDGKRPAPRLQREIPLTMNCSRKVTRVWTATPDAHAGAVVELPFTQKNGKLSFTLPSLKYWSMVVVE